MFAGVIGERLVQYGQEIARIKLKDESAWLTEIGTDDYVFIAAVPMTTRLAVFDRIAPRLLGVLNEIGKARLSSLGQRLLMMKPSEKLDFTGVSANA